ncbi:LPS translocon maturation chaperone LptM [Methyloversatilis universalis]|uniref:LPS translocon maturation chaperone LptM n=1 Tax=Methyloversatilis universalis TaxID=378211 RepID=UPI0009DB5CB9|nr:lipoprotein [Methyloversatilis universalis]
MFSSPLVRLAALTLALAGCGTKGPLTMPPKPGSQPAAAKPSPASAPQDTNKAVKQ